MWSNSRARAAVDSREMDRGKVREVTVVGHACGDSRAAMEAG